MLSIKDLSFCYSEEPVLKDINISFETNHIHGIVGLNGSGKTTFFNVLAGFLPPDNGNILINNAEVLKKNIAYIDAESFFYPKLTASEFLSVFPKTNSNFNEKDLALIFNLPLEEFIENYSTGMKKKLLILSQLKQEKQLFIFDEPFNGLDIESNKSLHYIIELLNKRGKTIFIASHIIEPLFGLCHQIHHLKNKNFAKSYLPKEYELLNTEVFGEFDEHLKNTLSQSL